MKKDQMTEKLILKPCTDDVNGVFELLRFNRISRGRAAIILGWSIQKIIEEMGRRKISVFDDPSTDTALADDARQKGK